MCQDLVGVVVTYVSDQLFKLRLTGCFSGFWKTGSLSVGTGSVSIGKVAHFEIGTVAHFRVEIPVGVLILGLPCFYPHL